MKFVNELIKRESMDDTNIHASVITGKMRISSFTYTATEADTELTIAYLPAGRGRALPVFCRIETNGVTGNYTVGTGAYHDAVPMEPYHDAVVDNIATTTASADDTVQSFAGPVEGLPYHSLEDIPVILTGTIPVGATVKGLFIYNVT